MNSRIFDGFVEHERFHPAHHHMHYNLHVYALDLAELVQLDRRLPLFGHNRHRPISLHDSDYLDAQPGSLRKKLLRRVSAHTSVQTIHQVIMVTSPRLWGYVFNPVSFYFCFNLQTQLVAAVAEVNNTFGEKHVYVLSPPKHNAIGFPARFNA